MSSPVVLEGLFLHLVEDGFPLGIRDLNQALRALEAGFGLGDRENLMWLCQALWARTEDENRRIAILFRDLLPRPTDREISALTGHDSEPAALEKREDPERGQTQKTPRPNEGPAPGLEVSAADSAQGIGVPKARLPGFGRESFIVTPVPLVPLRGCVIAWRRFRTAMRTGPRVELDLEQTIAAKARNGFVPEPVLVPRRANRARVVLLVDAGPAMAALRHSTAVLIESLTESRLRESAVYYFHETPGTLFETESLTKRVPAGTAMERFPDSPAVIVSEAGCARGGVDPRRIQETRECLKAFGVRWRPVAWLNPMPKPRWRATSAASVARLQGVTMLPFTGDGLIQAIDLIRGQR